MIINGVWYENITCPKCRRRHPVEFDCAMVRGIAENAAALRAAENAAAGADESSDEMARRDARIAELEASIDKLAQCKGRFHTEANYLALIAVRNKSLHK